jgi:serine/alanine racemase
MNMKKSYDTIDLFKLIASILIFAMHIHALRSVGESIQFYGVNLLARWGVPFFFITSSFFLFSKGTNGNVTGDQLKKYVKRILTLYALWFIFNIPYIVDTWFLSYDLTTLLSWGIIAKQWFVSSNTFMGSWYLMSCVFSACVVYLMSKKMKNRTILFITFFTYLFCVMSCVYRGFLPEAVVRFVPTAPYNGVICGCFFFAIGKWMAENMEKLSRVPQKLYLGGGLLFLALYYAEIILVKRWIEVKRTDAALMLIPTAVFLFLFAVNSTLRLSGAAWIRKVSTIIYCSQGSMIYLSSLLCEVAFHTQHSLIITSVACLMMCAVIVLVFFLQKKTKVRWPAYLT